MRRQGHLDAFGSRKTLWLVAAVLAAAWVPQLQANDLDPLTSHPPQSQAAEGQDHQNAETLARELAATRHDLEVLLKLLNKARDEQARTKEAADREIAELRKALQQERDQTARANQDSEGGAAKLRKSMLRDQAERMERDLAAMRRGLEPQAPPSTRTSDEAGPSKQAAEATLAELRKSLQQERDRASRIEQDLAAARRDVATQTALAARAGEQANQLKKTANDTADLQKSLQQEHDRASRLEQDLAAARVDIETQTALAAKAGEQAAQLKHAAEESSLEQRQSLQQEHDKAEALARELATARSKIYAYDAQARQVDDQAAALKQAAESGTADLQESLQQEHDRAEALARELSATRRDVETQTALATKAAAEASQLKKTADAGSAELRESLQQGRDRASRLEQDLAAARRDVEAQTTLAAKAAEEAAGQKQASESRAAELRQSLQRERDRTAELERDLALARSKENAPSVVATAQINPPGEAEAPKPVTAEQAAVIDAQAGSRPEDAAEVARLVARASVLLGRGDIGSARIVLERAAEAGNAQASFKLAETYDPLILSKWGTYGTRGDATKALDLYAKAQAGGLKEAQERVDALHR